MATKILSYEEIIEQARSTWTGKTGDERAESVKNILDTRLENYSLKTGISKDEILTAFEKKRNVNTVNFYQAANFPLLENVFVFETLYDFKSKFPSGKTICPSCGKESTNTNRLRPLRGLKRLVFVLTAFTITDKFNTSYKTINYRAMANKIERQLEIDKYEKFMHWLWRQKSITGLVMDIGMDGIAKMYVKECGSDDSSHESSGLHKHGVIKSVCLNCGEQVEPILHTYKTCPKCTHEF